MSVMNRDRKYTPKTSRLESHYQRLVARWQTTAAAVTLQEIAEELGCCRRYTRVLLQSMMARQWLSWTGQRGQGARGRLHCRVKDVSMQEKEKIFLEVSATLDSEYESSPPEDVSSNRVCIRFYRPIDAIVPSDHTGRVERHLLNMVHAGLTSINDQGVAVPDVAMAAKKSQNLQTWRFPLRQGLTWHNGEPVHADQLLQSLQIHLARPAFSHVTSVELEKDRGIDTLILSLSRPDAMLAYRLADPVHRLAHPQSGETGLGPFAIRVHNDHQLQLEASYCYHGTKPRIQTIEYSIEARLPGRQWTTVVLLHPDEEPEGATFQYLPKDDAGFVYLAFNNRSGSLNPSQQRFIQALAGVALRSLIGRENVSPVSEQWSVPALSENAEVVLLPPAVTLGYFWAPETEALMKNLQRQMRYWGCKLTIRPIDANLWFLPEKWDDCDIGVSDLRFQTPWWFAPETRFCHSVMIRQFTPPTFYSRLSQLLIRLGRDEARYPERIRRIMDLLIRTGCVSPLFTLKFEVRASKGICDVTVFPQGWPDFNRIWVDVN